MSSYLKKVTKSKEAFRKKLASKSIGEKLTLLDRLAERSKLLKQAKR